MREATAKAEREATEKGRAPREGVNGGDGPRDLLGHPVRGGATRKLRRGAMTLSGPVDGVRLRALSLGAGIRPRPWR